MRIVLVLVLEQKPVDDEGVIHRSRPGGIQDSDSELAV